MNGDRPIYVLDTNVFVEAARNYYAFDIVPRFWKSLIEQAECGQITSIDRVKAEIDRYGDEDDLKVWANSSFRSWFASTDEGVVLDAYRLIIEWANEQQQYRNTAKEAICRGDNADAWVVAYAKANNCVVVTHEGDQPKAIKNIPIPNVCKAFDVRYTGIYKMLREIRVTIC